MFKRIILNLLLLLTCTHNLKSVLPGILIPATLGALASLKQYYCNRALLDACQHDDFRLAKIALTLGANPNCAYTHNDGTPIATATALGHAMVTDEMAIKKGTKKHFQLSELLVAHGANINERPEYELAQGYELEYTKTTPLMGAIQHFDLPRIEFLITHGADLNRKDHEGNTALHHLNYALERRREAANPEGHIPEFIAWMQRLLEEAERKTPDILKLLLGKKRV